MKRIAFYAPIKPPDHPIPSGDRLIAGNLTQSLKAAGYDVELASRYIAYSKREADDILAERKSGALKEAERLSSTLSDCDLFLTYHPYCKAPDWIGPIVSRHLNIPYVTVEAAKTGQGFENGQDRWRHWREEAQQGIKQADRHMVFKPTDRTYLTELLGSDETLVDLPPFIDAPDPNQVSAQKVPEYWRTDVPIVSTVAMMRPGKKTRNFEILSDALNELQSLHWNLIVVGGGPEEEHVKSLFSEIDPSRLYFTGAVDHSVALSFLKSSDIFVWPGWQEPIGMVYLEAQSLGLPVAALNSMGVPLVVKHGTTGLLADNETGFKDAIATLLAHPSLRHDLAAAARNYVLNNHSLSAAAQNLKHALDPLLDRG